MRFKRIVEIDFLIPMPKDLVSSDNTIKYKVTNEKAIIEFKVENISGNFTSNCEVKIFGMTMKTFNELNPKQDTDKIHSATIKVGYEGDKLLSKLMTGRIYFAEFDVNKGEFVATFKLMSYNYNFSEKKLTGLNTFPAGNRLMDIIRSIVAYQNVLSLEVVLERGDSDKGIGGTLYEELRMSPTESDMDFSEMSVMESLFFLINNTEVILGGGVTKKTKDLIDFSLIDNKIYLIEKGFKTYKEIRMSFDTGLITYPKIRENRNIEIETMLNPLYDINTVIVINYDEDGRITEYDTFQTKRYKINEITHQSSGIDTHKTTLTCKEV